MKGWADRKAHPKSEWPSGSKIRPGTPNMNVTQNLQDALAILAKASSTCYGDLATPIEFYRVIQNAKTYLGTQLAKEVIGE